jgi:hypothetical protein
LSGELYIDHLTLRSFIGVKNFTEFWRDALQDKIVNLSLSSVALDLISVADAPPA